MRSEHDLRPAHVRIPPVGPQAVPVALALGERHVGSVRRWIEGTLGWQAVEDDLDGPVPPSVRLVDVEGALRMLDGPAGDAGAGDRARVPGGGTGSDVDRLPTLLLVESDDAPALVADVGRHLDALEPQDFKRLARLDLRVGRHVVYLPAGLKPAARALRATLWRVRHGSHPPVPPDNATSFVAQGSPAFYLAVGFPVVGGVAVRADALERVYALARKLAPGGPFGLPPELPSWLGADPDTAGRVLEGLGFQRVNTDIDARFVPPPPPRAPHRPRRAR